MHNEPVAVVTGGAVRIGRALVDNLLADGYRIVCHYRSSETAARACQARDPDRVEIVRADLSDPVNAAKTVFAAAAQRFGHADVLINSASIFEPGDLLSTDHDQWDRHFDINLKAPFFLAQAFVRQLPRKGQGALINIVDWRGTHPTADYSAYTLTKAGLVAMTRNLAQQLAPAVRVNAVAPGAILPAPDSSEDEFRKLADKIPLRRTGQPDDIVRAVRYLLESPFVTGEILHVTGGEQLP